ncbi:unnamed protein product [Prorocentrum cordatum]|uniref:Endonuclease/exonuclease/phosphatase domain-containing protein n=1 Tax=Prorocentrum cordatum TaxID=2364126 RepID=A0ABN9U3N4_9DINO|nr:unnamed protein product [Polarella glacialis]
MAPRDPRRRPRDGVVTAWRLAVLVIASRRAPAAACLLLMPLELCSGRRGADMLGIAAGAAVPVLRGSAWSWSATRWPGRRGTVAPPGEEEDASVEDLALHQCWTEAGHHEEAFRRVALAARVSPERARERIREQAKRYLRHEECCEPLAGEPGAGRCGRALELARAGERQGPGAGSGAGPQRAAAGSEARGAPAAGGRGSAGLARACGPATDMDQALRQQRRPAARSCRREGVGAGRRHSAARLAPAWRARRAPAGERQGAAKVSASGKGGPEPPLRFAKAKLMVDEFGASWDEIGCGLFVAVSFVDKASGDHRVGQSAGHSPVDQSASLSTSAFTLLDHFGRTVKLTYTRLALFSDLLQQGCQWTELLPPDVLQAALGAPANSPLFCFGAFRHPGGSDGAAETRERALFDAAAGCPSRACASLGCETERRISPAHLAEQTAEADAAKIKQANAATEVKPGGGVKSDPAKDEELLACYEHLSTEMDMARRTGRKVVIGGDFNTQFDVGLRGEARLARLRGADSAADRNCQLCGAALGTLLHRRVCEACQDFLPSLSEARCRRWFTEPPDATRDDLIWYTDGSMKFGPLWELRRTGCGIAVVSDRGDFVAFGSAVPPPWIRTAAAAELWAVSLALTIALVSPRIRTNCQSILASAAAGTAQAAKPTRMLAQLWSRVATLLDGDVSELIASGRLTWMPSHGFQADDERIQYAARFLLTSKLSTSYAKPAQGPRGSPGHTDADSVANLCSKGEEQSIMVIPQSSLDSTFDETQDDENPFNYPHRAKRENAERMYNLLVEVGGCMCRFEGHVLRIGS